MRSPEFSVAHVLPWHDGNAADQFPSGRIAATGSFVRIHRLEAQASHLFCLAPVHLQTTFLPALFIPVSLCLRNAFGAELTMTPPHLILIEI